MKLSTHARVLSLVVSSALLSCAAPQKMDIAAVRKMIEEESDKWMEAYNRGDAAAVAAMYADDAKVLPPNIAMVQGRTGIQEFWSGAMQMGLKDVRLTTVDVGGSGDTAYEIGNYSVTIQPEGGEGIRDSGKYVVVWKRQSDRTWKLVVDIWNSSMPAPPQ